MIDMNPVDWLKNQFPSLRALPEAELDAVQHFSLLWGLFEGELLNQQASASKLMGLAHNGVSLGVMDMSSYQDTLNYFKSRYFNNGTGNFTSHFNRLNLRGNDYKPLVEAVLRGENTDPADCISVVLIVIYRFRNNLFHGAKWDYLLAGQHDNFSHANRVLMTAYNDLQDVPNL